MLDDARKGEIDKNAKVNTGAKVLLVANEYDRMTAMNDVDEPKSEITALRYLMDRPEIYDADIVNALIESINFLAPGSCVELTNGEKGLVLAENPYYSTTSEDPQRFIDMVNRIKSGRGSTITTASSQEENLEESPVPVTLITEDMIRISGARNLKEVLLAYVPGMTSVDCNDDINIAMRGIFSQGQEKMLILLNGHRLNSYATNVASPDFSISLDKVKQIEVLRGPASSLYGGVALSAVVNVITKQGIDIDGLRLRASGGSYGQLRGDILFGKRFFDLDILVWGSLYKADGQRFFVPRSRSGLGKTEGDVRIGRVGDKPSYDLGLMLSWRGLNFLYNTHFSQIHSPYTMSYTYSPYNVSDYATFRGLVPSFATQSHHIELSYRRQWDRLSLNGTINYDLSDMTHYQVITDSAVNGIGLMLGLPETFGALFDNAKNLFRYHDGQEKNIGVQIKGDYKYLDGETHKGLLGFGANFSRFSLEDSRYVVGSGHHAIIEYSTGEASLGTTYLQWRPALRL